MTPPRSAPHGIRASFAVLVLALAIAAMAQDQGTHYVDDRIGYRLEAPAGWALHPDPAGAGVEVTPGDEALVALFAEWIPPEHLAEFTAMTPEAWGRSAPALLAGDLDDVRVLRAYVTTLAGVRAIAVDLEGVDPGRGVPAVGRLVVAVHDGRLLFLVATVDAALADVHAAAIDAIVASLDLTERP